MRRIVILVSEPDIRDLAGFIPELVREAASTELDFSVCVLGQSTGELGPRLAEVNPHCTVLSQDHGVRIQDWRAFKQQILETMRPELLHAVGPFAARVAYLHTGVPLGQNEHPPVVLVSGIDSLQSDATGWLTRRALRAADGVMAATTAEAERYQKEGVEAERIAVIAPFAPTGTPSYDPAAFRANLDIPTQARLIIAAGHFDDSAGLKTAVWAFDVVKYVAPDLFLILAGDGPDREKLERFGRSVGFDDYRVRFLPPPFDLTAVMAQAEMVWVTHQRGGVAETLAAFARGRPVVAVENADLTELILPGQTGRFVPPTDRVALAAVTNEWLTHPELATRFAEAGQQLVWKNFSVKLFVDRMVNLYHNLSRTSPVN
ncbi:MAG: glycosyltransferase family 4 protein [Bacteroidales bacterium]|nr:glycosyltransferase family 4 protein [Bacteroidales bacterium]